MVYLLMAGVSCPLVLDGHDLKLLSIKVDGKELKVILLKIHAFFLFLWQNFPLHLCYKYVRSNSCFVGIKLVLNLDAEW